MEPSKYQLAIYDAIETTTENLVVEAVAGSGKSTTAEHGVGHLEPTCDTAIFAFNKEITVAMERRMARAVAKPDNLHISTMNSFGWGICRKNSKGVQLDPNKTEFLMRPHFDLDDDKQRGRFYRWRYSIDRLIRLFKANCFYGSVEDSDIEEMADYHGMDISEDPNFKPLVKMLWDSSAHMTGVMDFADQIYQPLMNGWSIPQFDVGVVDELQDLNPAQQNLMLKACRRFIGFGDSRQAIYAFAGADARSLANMVERTGSKVLPLSVCYRCPKSVVKRAQKIVPQIEWCEWAPEGVVDQKQLPEFRKLAQAGDFVLCRTTAPLVTECLGMIREGKRAMVKGKEIGEQLIALIEKLGVPDRDSTERLYNQLMIYHAEQVQRLARANREQMIEALNDRVETIKVLLENEATVGDVKRRIKSIFSDQVSGVMFSTIHKAKGLESLRVWILRPDLLPHPNAKTPEAREQEANLEYVAITRAMFTLESHGELYFVPKGGQ